MHEIIGPHTLMTAGHVVYIKNSGVPGRDGFVRSIKVMPGRNGTTLPYGSVTSNNLRTVQGWATNGDEEHDYGAIILDTDLGPTTGWFGFGVYNNATLTAVGGQHLRLPGRQARRHPVVRRSPHRVGGGAQGVLPASATTDRCTTTSSTVSGGQAATTRNVVDAVLHRRKHPRTYYTDETDRARRQRARELIQRSARRTSQAQRASTSACSPPTTSGFVYAMNVFYAGDARQQLGRRGCGRTRFAPATPVALATNRKFNDYQITDMGERAHAAAPSATRTATWSATTPTSTTTAPATRVGYGVGYYCLMCYGGSDTNPDARQRIPEERGRAGRTVTTEHRARDRSH